MILPLATYIHLAYYTIKKGNRASEAISAISNHPNRIQETIPIPNTLQRNRNHVIIRSRQRIFPCYWLGRSHGAMWRRWRILAGIIIGFEGGGRRSGCQDKWGSFGEINQCNLENMRYISFGAFSLGWSTVGSSLLHMQFHNKLRYFLRTATTANK